MCVDGPNLEVLEEPPLPSAHDSAFEAGRRPVPSNPLDVHAVLPLVTVNFPLLKRDGTSRINHSNIGVPVLQQRAFTSTRERRDSEPDDGASRRRYQWLKEVAIYDKALTPTQVQNHRTAAGGNYMQAVLTDSPVALQPTGRRCLRRRTRTGRRPASSTTRWAE